MFWQGEDGEAFRGGVFQPCGESECGVAVGSDEFVERGLGSGESAGIPHGAQFRADATADGEIGRVMDGIGGQTKLASLPDGDTEYYQPA